MIVLWMFHVLFADKQWLGPPSVVTCISQPMPHNQAYPTFFTVEKHGIGQPGYEAKPACSYMIVMDTSTCIHCMWKVIIFKALPLYFYEIV